MAILFDRYDITFAEVPDEVSLTFSITNCQGRCEGCHSPHLRENKGTDLLQVLPELLEKYKGMITCVCFLGEGNDADALQNAMQITKDANIKVCLYSGREYTQITFKIVGMCDYLKTGAYVQSLGGITAKGTNQKMYKRIYGDMPWAWQDITYKFRKEYMQRNEGQNQS